MDIGDADILRFKETVLNNSDYNLNDYSNNSLKRRLTKISEDYDSSFEKLINRISEDPVLMEEVIKKITVNTTELFRDTDVWIQIMNTLLPRFEKYSSIHIWHPGCSTGQEVYSMMILLDQLGLLDKAHIYASDINTDVMEIAKQGKYRLRFNREYIENFQKIFNADSSKSYKSIEHYFSVNEMHDLIEMHDFLIKKPVYEKIDLVKDDNLFFINFDIILCRNVIIYFNYDLQIRVLNMFHRNMRNNGCLVLGLHESIIGEASKGFMKTGGFYLKK